MGTKTILEMFRNKEITEEETVTLLGEEKKKASKKEEVDDNVETDEEEEEDEEEDDDDVVESKKCKKENLDNFGDKIAPPFEKDDGKKDKKDEEEIDEEIDGDAENDETTKKIKKSVPSKAPDLSKVKESFEADLNILVESEATLSESFKEKASVIFEAAFKTKLVEEINRLEETYQEQLIAETKEINDSIVEKVNGYLSYVVENWIKENELAITNGLRSEIAESFMSSLSDVFTEHYVEVPDSKVDLVDGLAKKVEKLEEELSSTIGKSIELKEDIKNLTKEKVIRESVKDLTDTQAEKLVSLATDIDFSTEESYQKKVDILKESYFGKTANHSDHPDLEKLNENDENDTVYSPIMANYLKAINRN